ncbi:MAG: MBOAT family O-acyltransferase, partial [Moraxellaceae bacterium]|nr:MBOAT family O-acyltransferase [Moraxellaceae bacterium]
MAGVTLNLSVLGWFKYAGFFASNLELALGTSLAFTAPALPLAISFFSFQKIAYLSDMYARRIGRVRIHEFAFFVLFFPQLIAGPIVHFREIVPQIRSPEWLPRALAHLPLALVIFSIGFAKKTLIADSIAQSIDPTFSFVQAGGSVDAIRAWHAALGYTAQLYFDFSGYSDMAIGLALLFGIRLPINFASPYKSTSIIEFWRRWHITLSRFLTEYLYIPLGGNRCGPARRFGNLMIVMLLGGLWHGAQWTFVAWGALHGSYLVANHAWNKIRPAFSFRHAGLMRAFGWFITFLCVVVAWVLFRAADFSSELTIYAGMAGGNGLLDRQSFAAQAARNLVGL